MLYKLADIEPLKKVLITAEECSALKTSRPDCEAVTLTYFESFAILSTMVFIKRVLLGKSSATEGELICGGKWYIKSDDFKIYEIEVVISMNWIY